MRTCVRAAMCICVCVASVRATLCMRVCAGMCLYYCRNTRLLQFRVLLPEQLVGSKGRKGERGGEDEGRECPRRHGSHERVRLVPAPSVFKSLNDVDHGRLGRGTAIGVEAFPAAEITAFSTVRLGTHQSPAR